MTYNIGDMVMITNNGETFSTMKSWLSPDFRGIYGAGAPNKGAIGKVVQVGFHASDKVGEYYGQLLGVEINDQIFIITHKGVKRHSVHIKGSHFTVGDEVRIIDLGKTYTTYKSWIVDKRIRTLYDKNHQPSNNEVGTIFQVAQHEEHKHFGMLIGVLVKERAYIIGWEGVESTQPTVIVTEPKPSPLSDAQILHAALAMILDEDRRTLMPVALDYFTTDNPSLESIGVQINAMRARLGELL